VSTRVYKLPEHAHNTYLISINGRVVHISKLLCTLLTFSCSSQLVYRLVFYLSLILFIFIFTILNARKLINTSRSSLYSTTAAASSNRPTNTAWLYEYILNVINFLLEQINDNDNITILSRPTGNVQLCVLWYFVISVIDNAVDNDDMCVINLIRNS